MAITNTYTQIHIQCVFAPKYRQALLLPTWKDSLHKYITGIVQNYNHKMLAINSMPDHLHMFFGMRPTQSISDLMREVKSESSEWINKNMFTPWKFTWQEGFGAFSYRKKDVPTIIKYIRNQEIHHQHLTFKDEYRDLLKEFEIDFDDRFLFKDPI